MATKLETYTGFSISRTAEYFAKRGWSVKPISVEEVNLIKVAKGSALECGDGRFDKLEDRKVVEGEAVHGVRVFGGVNAIMALLTGGDEVGLLGATDLLRRFGLTPGTHSAEEGGCGYADLWIAGELESALYPYELQQANRGGLRLGLWLPSILRDLGGKHFRLNGNHKEEGVRLNPFRGYTEVADDGLRFRIDDWFMADLGIPDNVRFFKILETVTKLKPDATKLEIITS